MQELILFAESYAWFRIKTWIDLRQTVPELLWWFLDFRSSQPRPGIFSFGSMKQEDMPYLLAIIPCQFPKIRKWKFEIYSSAILSCRVLESGKVNLILVIRNKVIWAQPPRTLKMLMRENQNANTAAPKRLTRKVLLQKATVCSPAVHNSIVRTE